MDNHEMPQQNGLKVGPGAIKLRERIAAIGAVAALLSSGTYVLVYFQTGAWQMLVQAGFLLAAAVGSAIAWTLVRRRRLNWAAAAILAVPILAFAGGELSQAGTALNDVVAGGFLVILAGAAFLPGKWWIWLGAVLVHLGCIALANVTQPLLRVDYQTSAMLGWYVPAGTGVVLLLVVIQLARAFRVGTIRTRLLIAFTTLAVLLAVVLTAASIWVGWQNSQQQVASQLESAATLKEREIQSWLVSLSSDMALLTTVEQTTTDADVILRGSRQFGSYEYARRDLLTRFQSFLQESGRFEELFVMDLTGQVLLSTVAGRDGQVESDRTYFSGATAGPLVSVPFYSIPLGHATIIAARPIEDETGKVLGLVAGRAQIDTLTKVMAERAGMGRTGETYLVSAGGMLLTPTWTVPSGPILTAATRTAILEQKSGSAQYRNYDNVAVIGVYHWIPELGAVLVAEQAQAETLQVAQTMLLTNVAVALVAAVVAIAASLFVTRSIASPLAGLVDTARQVTAGNLGLRAHVGRLDEIGTLGQAFNQMTGQLQEMIGSLERRVAERTADLEDRSRYLQAAAAVGRDATSILETDRLIQQVVDLIRERFDLYYVGLFLTDEAANWAVLQAGTGQAGRAMVARGHRIHIGEGMIGWSIAHGEPRVALEAEADAFRLASPELPETRSEAALPLRSRGRVLGALTVQSARYGAFEPDTLAVLETMADQVAVALDNARLFADSQKALEGTRRAYGEIGRAEWARLVRSRPDLAFRSDAYGISPASDQAQPEVNEAIGSGRTVRDDGQSRVAVPIKIRGEIVGALDAAGPAGRGWSASEISLLESISEQLGLALEGARLYQDTQQRAAQERLVGEVTARMRETLDVEKVLQTAAQEIGRALDLRDLTIRLNRGA